MKIDQVAHTSAASIFCFPDSTPLKVKKFSLRRITFDYDRLEKVIAAMKLIGVGRPLVCAHRRCFVTVLACRVLPWFGRVGWRIGGSSGPHELGETHVFCY
jgi:hypothetical protein